MEQAEIIDTFGTYHPNTPNTMVNYIGALVRRRDGKIWVIGVAKQGNTNL